MSSAYEVLDIKQGSSAQDLKKAYRKLALEHHPDKGGDVEKFKKVQNAYEKVLGVIQKAQMKAVNPVVKFNPPPEGYNKVDEDDQYIYYEKYEPYVEPEKPKKFYPKIPKAEPEKPKKFVVNMKK